MTDTEAITPAILQYVEDGTYPDSEATISADVAPAQLEQLLSALRKEQDDVKAEIRSLSKVAAPDIDTWIARAKQLQEDIQRSRDVARQIVEEAETTRTHKARAQDSENKVKLLEREVAFQDALGGTLEHVKYANALLGKVQEAVVALDIERAFTKLEDAEASIAGLQGVQSSRAYGVLQRRAMVLREDIFDAATTAWNDIIQVKSSPNGSTIKDHWERAPNVRLQTVVNVLLGLDKLDPLISRLARDMNRLIFSPMFRSNNLPVAHRFADLKNSLEYFAEKLPTSIKSPLSEKLIPGLAGRIEEAWLEPAIPLETSNLPELDGLLSRATDLADHIDSLGWSGAQPLRDWVQNAPRTWLTKRREAALGDARTLVFTGLKERQVVERVETQLVTQSEAVPASKSGTTGQQGGEDAWDDAWDEPEEEKPVPHLRNSDTSADVDEDASAWELDDSDNKTPSSATGEEDAWGWGDDEGSKAQETQKAAKDNTTTVNGTSAPQHAREREVTLREAYTVTAIPDSLLEILKHIVADAETLAGPEFATSPVAPAGTALYTLPTLVLAIYRATATTAYSKLDVGNMLIYNDATRLAEGLGSWQASQPPATRLRVGNDVKALEQFAKRAYSAEMEAQRTILRDLLDGAQSFTNCTIAPFKAECESAIEQVVGRLRDVHRQWKDVLASSALLQSIGSLLASVITKMITEVEELGDISEAESTQLKQLCDTMSEVKDLFTQQMPDGSIGDMAFVYCPNWLKFQYLAEILVSSLADIKYLWHEGELSLEFDGDEVVELIEALFAESDLRRRAIIDIRNSMR